jgi:N-acetylmuramoyl-L-alanine amidase
MKKILLQSGHQNATNGQTGAPEEQANNIRIRNRLSQILISKGFQLFLADANFSSKEHFDLALALHCDSDYPGNEGGGFVACADPSVDNVWNESKRIEASIASEYFKHSGIREVDSRENANTLYYYWWYNLSLDTPCVLIEMGESIDPHDKVLLADTDRIANAIARGVCKAFNVSFDQTVPPEIPDWKKKYEDEVNAHTNTKEVFKKYKEDAALDKENAVKDALKKLNDRIDVAQGVA